MDIIVALVSETIRPMSCLILIRCSPIWIESLIKCSTMTQRGLNQRCCLTLQRRWFLLYSDWKILRWNALRLAFLFFFSSSYLSLGVSFCVHSYILVFLLYLFEWTRHLSIRIYVQEKSLRNSANYFFFFLTFEICLFVHFFGSSDVFFFSLLFLLLCFLVRVRVCGWKIKMKTSATQQHQLSARESVSCDVNIVWNVVKTAMPTASGD